MRDRHTSPPRRLLLLSFLIVGLGILGGQAVTAQKNDLRYTIMVSKFENQSNFAGYRTLRNSWSTILTNQLNQTGRFIVVAESDMQEEAMKEQARGASGITAQGRRTAVRGQMAPAQLLVKGIITHFQHDVSSGEGGLSVKGIGVNTKKETAEINVTLQMVDASTGIVVASRDVVGTSTQKRRALKFNRDGIRAAHKLENNENVKSALTKAVGHAVEWMTQELDRIPWRGTVVLVKGDKIYIDRGSREGVTQGAKFTVGESEIIRSPGTGEVLDEIVTERARIEVVSVQDKSASCRVISGDIGILYEGMGVAPVSL